MTTWWRFPTLPASVPPPTSRVFLSQPIVDVDMPYKFASRRVKLVLDSSIRLGLASPIFQTRSCMGESIGV